jgi:alpha-tubulin suppressor-like RCC1 family protein
VSCWGDNAAVYPNPVRLASGDPVTGAKALALGIAHSRALLGENEVNCWEANLYGQLGDGTDDERIAPAPVLMH